MCVFIKYKWHEACNLVSTESNSPMVIEYNPFGDASARVCVCVGAYLRFTLCTVQSSSSSVENLVCAILIIMIALFRLQSTVKGVFVLSSLPSLSSSSSSSPAPPRRRYSHYLIAFDLIFTIYLPISVQIGMLVDEAR